MNDAAFEQLCERGACDGGGRLHIEADPAEFEQGPFDLNFRDGDGRAASRMRPSLGQPNSPIMISLPGIANATLLRIASTCAAASDAGSGKSSQ